MAEACLPHPLRLSRFTDAATAPHLRWGVQFPWVSNGEPLVRIWGGTLGRHRMPVDLDIYFSQAFWDDEVLKLSPIFTGFAAANDLDGKSDHQSRAAMGVLLRMSCVMRPTAMEKSASCRNFRHHLDARRRSQNDSDISHIAKDDECGAHCDARSIRGRSAHCRNGGGLSS